MQILKQWLGKSCCWISRQRDERVFFKHEQHWKTGECRSFGQWSDNWAEKPPTAFMKHREEWWLVLHCHVSIRKKKWRFWDSGWAPKIETTGKVPVQGVPSIFPHVDLSTVDALYVGMKLAYKLWLKRWAVNRSMQLSFFANIHSSSFNSCCWFLSMFCLLFPRHLADKLDTFWGFFRQLETTWESSDEYFSEWLPVVDPPCDLWWIFLPFIEGPHLTFPCEQSSKRRKKNQLSPQHFWRESSNIIFWNQKTHPWLLPHCFLIKHSNLILSDFWEYTNTENVQRWSTTLIADGFCFFAGGVCLLRSFLTTFGGSWCGCGQDSSALEHGGSLESRAEATWRVNEVRVWHNSTRMR